jgi:hypothetical protein
MKAIFTFLALSINVNLFAQEINSPFQPSYRSDIFLLDSFKVWVVGHQ